MNANVCTYAAYLTTGVMEAVDAIIEHLKRMSKQVTTPEEIAQVSCLTVHRQIHSAFLPVHSTKLDSFSFRFSAVFWLFY